MRSYQNLKKLLEKSYFTQSDKQPPPCSRSHPSKASFVFLQLLLCGETNGLITNQNIFFTVKPIKKFSLKHSFYKVVFTCFFN